jgi:hypothetical protein
VPSVLLGAMLYPGIALADNLGSLIYVFAIWPLNAFLLITLLVLGIITAVLIRGTGKGKRYPKLGIAMMVIPLMACVASPTLTFVLDDASNARGDTAAFAISIVPPVATASICLVLGIVLFVRSLRSS